MFDIYKDEQRLKYWENSPISGNTAHLSKSNGGEGAKCFLTDFICFFMTITFILILYRINLHKSKRVMQSNKSFVRISLQLHRHINSMEQFFFPMNN